MVGVKVCSHCAEELPDESRRCSQCGRDPDRPPAARAPDRPDEWWKLPEPDPAATYENPGRPEAPESPESDLRLLEPPEAREAPVNEKAFGAAIFAAIGGSLSSMIAALFLAHRAEQEIEESGGRQGGMIFVKIARVLSVIGLIAIGLVLASFLFHQLTR